MTQKYKPVHYLQIDKRWSDTDYSAPGEKTTIGRAGCGPTCMAMVAASLLKDPGITPAGMAAWSLKHGYKAAGQGTYYTYFVEQGKALGIEVRRVNQANLRNLSNGQSAQYHQAALDAVRAGDWVIACMGPGLWTKGGHYILWWGVSGDKAQINDPASMRSERLLAPISRLQAEVKYYWVVRTTAGNGKKEDDIMGKVYKDVADDRWSAKAIEKAKELGIISGGTDGNFRPTDALTREQAAVISVRLYEAITGKKVL